MLGLIGYLKFVSVNIKHIHVIKEFVINHRRNELWADEKNILQKSRRRKQIVRRQRGIMRGTRKRLTGGILRNII
jgi:hypothetical protein